jgi:hypothetical protein
MLTGDDLDRNVIDEMVSDHPVLQAIPFHRAAAQTGGSAHTYGYTRLTYTPGSGFRALNANYDTDAAVVSQEFVTCAILGGKFGIDRVLAYNPAQISLQFSQLAKSARSTFCNAIVNGDSSGGSNQFDGLSVALAGSDTELVVDGSDDETWDWSDPINDFDAIIGNLEELTQLVSGQPDAIYLNHKVKAKLVTAGRKANYFEHTKNDFGRPVTTFNGIPIVDIGTNVQDGTPIIANTVDAGVTTSDVYVVRYGLDGFHAVSPANQDILKTYLPDLTTGGNAVAYGEVEMVATVALKETKAASVARGIKIA